MANEDKPSVEKMSDSAKREAIMEALKTRSAIGAENMKPTATLSDSALQNPQPTPGNPKPWVPDK